ncbi:MAG: hypothetical protein ACREWG_00495 [Gammaproteobacteria bacterium]
MSPETVRRGALGSTLCVGIGAALLQPFSHVRAADPAPEAVVAAIDQFKRVCPELFPDLKPKTDTAYRKWAGAHPSVWNQLRERRGYRSEMDRLSGEWRALSAGQKSDPGSRQKCEADFLQLLSRASDPRFVRFAAEYVRKP